MSNDDRKNWEERLNEYLSKDRITEIQSYLESIQASQIASIYLSGVIIGVIGIILALVIWVLLPQLFNPGDQLKLYESCIAITVLIRAIWSKETPKFDAARIKKISGKWIDRDTANKMKSSITAPDSGKFTASFGAIMVLIGVIVDIVL